MKYESHRTTFMLWRGCVTAWLSYSKIVWSFVNLDLCSYFCPIFQLSQKIIYSLFIPTIFYIKSCLFIITLLSILVKQIILTSSILCNFCLTLSNCLIWSSVNFINFSPRQILAWLAYDLTFLPYSR